MTTDRLKLCIYDLTDTDFNYFGMYYGVTDTDLALLIP